MGKRVLYNTCTADPWVKVAQKLKDEYDYEPVYWIGIGLDNSDQVVPAVFQRRSIIHGLMLGREFSLKRSKICIKKVRDTLIWIF